jgi:hypothetical protein
MWGRWQGCVKRKSEAVAKSDGSVARHPEACAAPVRESGLPLTGFAWQAR